MFNVTFGESGNLPGLGELSTYIMNVYSGSNLQPVRTPVPDYPD